MRPLFFQRQLGRQVSSGPSVQSIVTTQDVTIYDRELQIKASDPGVIAQMNRYSEIITELEKSILLTGGSCTVKKLDTFQDNLTAINPLAVKKLLRENFHDPVIMKEIMCTMNSLFYLQPNHPGFVKPNERVKHWLRNLKQIGKESAFGFAFKTDFTHSEGTSTFILKSPRSPQNDLLHELIIGTQLNTLRSYVPNFAYVFGGFRCTPPILKETDDASREPVTWCNEGKLNVEYVIYENIVPSISMNDYVKNSTFSQFLDKYLQILYALLVAQDLMNFSHYDLHSENVLIRSSGSKMSIPYTAENNTTEYLNTDGIATIIDYGLSYLKTPEKESLGDPRALKSGVYPDRLIPLFDAYKLLMFSMHTMLINKNFTCLQRCESLFRFFNRTENVQDALNQQIRFLYILPDNDKTRRVTLADFLSYIRKSVPEFSEIVTSRPKYTRVLGCNGTDICVSEGQAIELLGYNSPLKMKDLFDFYDLVSRLEQEERFEDISEIISIFDINSSIKSAYNEYNASVDKVRSYFGDSSYETLSICGLKCYNILNPDILFAYKNFLIRTAEIKEEFQQVGLLYDSIKFAGRYYSIDTTELDENYNVMLDLFRDFVMILEVVRKDYQSLGPQNVQRLGIPEMEILI